jgi:hypothetical protein
VNPYTAAILAAQVALQLDAFRVLAVTLRDNLQRDGFTRAQANRMTAAVFSGSPDPESVKAALTPTRKASA